MLDPTLIISILEQLANVGFTWDKSCEITLEINPATMNEHKLNQLLIAGFNRFSVGAQTFNDALLKACGRRHTANDTRETLKFFKDRGVNYSFDLLFALPNQSLTDLINDLDEVCDFSPPHLSAYCLTVPEGHPMSRGRAPEDEQVDMFNLVTARLKNIGLEKYEISNFARPGFESRHNMVYWSDKSYWGLGVSAHSYDASSPPYGERFWNAKNLHTYLEQCENGAVADDQRERLLANEAMTDFCHISLRKRPGLSRDALRNKFGELASLIFPRLEKLQQNGELDFHNGNWTISALAEVTSNQVFEKLTFLGSDLN